MSYQKKYTRIFSPSLVLLMGLLGGCSSHIPTAQTLNGISETSLVTSILRVEPSTLLPGSTLVIIANGLESGQTTVTFGVGTGNEVTVPADQVQIEGRRLTVTVPANALAGPIRVTSPNGSVTTSPVTGPVVSPPPPNPTVITPLRVEPSSSSIGSSITIIANGLVPGTTVDFTAVSGVIGATQVKIEGRRLIVPIPKGAVTGPITLTSPGGTPARTSTVTIAPIRPVIANNLQFLGQATFAKGSVRVNNTEVGGLSGITYDANNIYYAISDDRGTPPNEPGQPPRFYTLTLDLSNEVLDNSKVQFTNVTSLRRNGSVFAPLSTDTESIALRGRTVFVSSEGEETAPGNQRVNPFINPFDLLSGEELQALPIPLKFQPDSPVAATATRGVRNNLGFESATVSLNQQVLLSATESALVQDGPDATLTNGSRARILQYSLQSNQPTAEFLYMTDPVAQPPVPDTAFRTAGLVDLLALDLEGNQLLALERSFSVGAPGTGNTIKIYSVNLAGATNIAGIETLDTADLSAIRPAEKRLLLNLNTLNLPLDNVEGLTLGPVLPSGRQSLILVSDNNFSPAATAFTQILAFAIE